MGCRVVSRALLEAGALGAESSSAPKAKRTPAPDPASAELQYRFGWQPGFRVLGVQPLTELGEHSRRMAL